jgi:hypothetical protein
MPNPAGIGADDFFTKPVQVDELLDWIGRRLRLDWLGASPAPATASAPPRPPAPGALAALRAQLAAGYVRGVRAELDRLAALGAAHHDFVELMRGHAHAATD